MSLSQERLKQLMVYDPLTGIFTRRIQAGSRGLAGDVAGTVETNGYVRISVDSRPYRAHRLAFLYMTGMWPEKDVDHRFGDTSDTTFASLREATKSENLQNSKKRVDNSSGTKGVSFRKDRGMFSVRMKVGNVYKSFGCYKELELAELVATEARELYHGSFARHT